MKEERIVYPNLKFQRTCQSENIQRLKESQKGKPSCVKHRGISILCPSWKVIAVILGTIFLTLLLTIGILVSKLNQKSSYSEEFPRKVFFQKTENKRVLLYPTCSINWHQYGGKCYYFSKYSHSWKDCDSFCRLQESRFLRVTTEEEKNFIINLSKMQCGMLKERFSISFSLDYYNKKHFSEDGTHINQDKFKFPEIVSLNSCTYIRNGQETTEGCQSKSYCICEKTIHFS